MAISHLPSRPSAHAADRDPVRVAAGVPSGGQFATTARAESNLRLLPLALDDVVPADGAHPVAVTEPGEQVGIRRVPGSDTFEVTARRSVDVVGGVFAHAGERLGHRTPTETRMWLSAHADTVAEHLNYRYAATLRPDPADPDRFQIEVGAEVPCDATVTDAVENLDHAWGVRDLREDLTGPTGGDLAGAEFYRRVAVALERADYRTDHPAHSRPTADERARILLEPR